MSDNVILLLITVEWIIFIALVMVLKSIFNYVDLRGFSKAGVLATHILTGYFIMSLLVCISMFGGGSVILWYDSFLTSHPTIGNMIGIVFWVICLGALDVPVSLWTKGADTDDYMYGVD